MIMENATIVSGVADVLRPFLRSHDKVFLCYAALDCVVTQSVCQAVKQLGGETLRWEDDRRWYALLRQAFSQRATVLVGSPRLILGLAKIARATGTPLSVRHVVLLGHGEDDWLHKGIRDSLDAAIYTCDVTADTPCLENPEDPLMRQLDERLLSWSSVLDFSAKQTEQGLSLEILVFPGRQLPKIPSGANVTVRPWQPKTDVPFCLCEC